MKQLMTMKSTMLLLLLALCVVPHGAKAQPRVYEQENTGAAFGLKQFKAVQDLPVIKTLPDALQGVTAFGDWERRRAAAYEALKTANA